MKKIFTLLLVAGALTTASAQTKQEESRRVILGKPGTTTEKKSTDPRDVILGREDGRYPSETRDQQIDEINREYNAKIQSIRNNPTLSAEEKERMIRQLELERQRKIRTIKNNDDRRHDDDDDDYDDKKKKDKKYGKKNNGKKLGWEKGVGNPHRTGSDKEYGKNKEKVDKEYKKEHKKDKKAKKVKNKKD